jgi:hypothetical protein
MEDFWMRITENLSDRVNGPMNVRFILQPIVATLIAIWSGLKDAKAGRPPYFWSLIFYPYDPARRRAMIKEGWLSIAKLVFAALTLDLIYQFIAQPTIYLRHAVIIAFLLVIAPYLILRGTITRLASRLMTRPTT